MAKLTERDWIDKRDRMPTKADEDQNGKVLVFNIYGGVMISGAEDFATYGGKYSTHWMRIPTLSEEGWVPVAERMPTRQDEDETGCILGYNQLHGAHVTSAGNLAAYGGQYETHWHKMPPRPRMDAGYAAEIKGQL